MSKSKGNVVNPDEFVSKYGADAVRMYLAFIGPYNEPGSYPWQLEGADAMRRFLDRINILQERVTDGEASDETKRALAQATAKVGEDADRFKFNTAISALMVLTRALEQLPEVPRSAYQQLLRLLTPFAPHLAEHLWEATGGEGSIQQEAWPEADEQYLTSDTATVVVQVNGKKRAEVTVPADSSEEEAMRAARQVPSIDEVLIKAKSVRVIYVPGRILNLVIMDKP
jgi:leucyl-tRNA synthetase